MISRRDWLAGCSCVGALGLAEALRPRERLTLMPTGSKLASLVPHEVSSWRSASGGDIVIPRTEGTLASTIYSDQLARRYVSDSGRAEIMVLAAYGAAQSDILQLHRPEVCYPAVGFEIAERRLVDLALPGHPALPVVAITATTQWRTEDLLYWTRVGNDLPQTSAEQRSDRLRAAFNGYVGDGVLFRMSAVRNDESPRFADLGAFARALVDSLTGPARLALLGPRFAA